MNEHGFIMFNRTDEAIELLRDPNAFALLALIARRARWRSLLSPDGLEFGEAMLGDCENFGMTRAVYRNRLKKLVKCKQITIRKTNKGTIAKLISSLVFNINLPAHAQRENHQQGQQRTNTEPSENHQKTNGEPLTNKERTEERNKVIKKNVVGRKDTALEIAATADFEELIERLSELYPEHNVRAEWTSYSKHRDQLDRPKTGITFVEWLEKAHIRIEDGYHDGYRTV
jgi:hypothetical protein